MDVQCTSVSLIIHVAVDSADYNDIPTELNSCITYIFDGSLVVFYCTLID